MATTGLLEPAPAPPIEDLWKDGLLAKIAAPRRQLALLVKLRPYIEGRITSRVVRVAETLSGGEGESLYAVFEP